MDDKLIARMRERMAMCRRLARSITDRDAVEALRKMADDIEADVLQREARTKD